MVTGKVGVVGPDLKSFIRQFPAGSEGDKLVDASDSMDDDGMRFPKNQRQRKQYLFQIMIPRQGSSSQRPRLHTRGSFRPPLSLPEEPTIKSSSSSQLPLPLRSEQPTKSLSCSQLPLSPCSEQPTRSLSSS